MYFERKSLGFPKYITFYFLDQSRQANLKETAFERANRKQYQEREKALYSLLNSETRKGNDIGKKYII